jgi:hypothetical protein
MKHKASGTLLCTVGLGFVFLVLLLVAGCGRTPPEAFWAMSAQDSTKVRAVVDAWKVLLKSDFADSVGLSENINYIPDTTRRALKQTMRENPYKIRWFPKTFSRTFSVDSMVDSVWTTKDTTVEVRLREFLSGTATITTDSITRLRNPDTIIGGMHFQIFDTFFTYQFPSPDSASHESTVVVPVTATCDRELYLEPNDKANRTEWTMKRLSGAGRYYCPDVAGAPYLGAIQLVTNTGRRDTFVLRPDTIHRGAQRLYNKDSLLTYAPGESIQVVMTAAALLGQLWWDPPDIAAFLHVGRARKTLRIGLPPTAFTFGAGDVGMKQIYIEVIRRDPLTEKTDFFKSCMWAIPVTVKAP